MKICQKESSPQLGIELQPPNHESDMLTTEPSRWGDRNKTFLGLKIYTHLVITEDDEYLLTAPFQENVP